MEEEFSAFLDALMHAASEMRDVRYFQLPVAGSDAPEYRERVYCYELYHQLRNALGDDYVYRLCGEVDKSGHPLISNTDVKDTKPDFVVHDPGRLPMRNMVVVEVKPVVAKPQDVQHDTEKLKAFVEEVGYYRGIMLIYGDGAQREIPDIVMSTKLLLTDDSILLLWHRGPGSRLRVVS